MKTTVSKAVNMHIKLGRMCVFVCVCVCVFKYTHTHTGPVCVCVNTRTHTHTTHTDDELSASISSEHSAATRSLTPTNKNAPRIHPGTHSEKSVP